MSQTSIRSQVHVSLDVHRNLTAKIALDLVTLIEHLAYFDHLFVAEVIALLVELDPRLVEDIPRTGAANAVQVRQRHFDSLIAG
jgi:hypothetical protein